MIYHRLLKLGWHSCSQAGNGYLSPWSWRLLWLEFLSTHGWLGVPRQRKLDMLTLNVTSYIIHIILILRHSSPCIHGFRPLISPAVKERIFFWQGVKWITHLSLAISDRSCCIFWLTRGDFSLPGLAMPNRSWFVAGKDRGCVGQAVHLVALSPSSHKPCKGCNSQILHQGTGRGRLRANTTTFGLPNQKCHLLAMPISKTDILPERNEWSCITQALSHEAGKQSPLEPQILSSSHAYIYKDKRGKQLTKEKITEKSRDRVHRFWHCARWRRWVSRGRKNRLRKEQGIWGCATFDVKLTT